MTKYAVIAFLILTALIQSCSDNDDLAGPDFSSCECPGFQMNIVCGNDGRTYLDSCLAQCVNVPIILSGSCPDAFNDPEDTLKWPIEFICIPIIREDDAKEIRTLADGSVLYQNSDDSYFRGTPNLCRCLPANSQIATPSGPRAISSLEIGDMVWTLDMLDDRIVQPIRHIRKVEVPDNHEMVVLLLEDNRWIVASPMHPDALGRSMMELNVGDCLDGATVIDKKLDSYDNSFTWDLLPNGETGLYYVNEILMSSTIRNDLKHTRLMDIEQ